MPICDQPKVKILGGCPDGFWSLSNCNYAAQLGICSVFTRTDDRLVTVEGGAATVTHPNRPGVAHG